MATTYTLIANSTVGSGGAAFMEFTSIPNTYTDLQLLFSVRYDGADTVGTDINFNGGSTTFSVLVLRGTGTAAQSFTFSAAGAGATANGSSGASQTSNTFTNTSIYIPNYAGSNYKSLSTDFVQESNVTGTFLGFYASLWSSTSAITALKISPSSGNWVQYSTAYLYGISNS